MQNFSPLGTSLHEAAEDADFSELDPDPVGVAGAWPKLKSEGKNRTCFMYIDCIYRKVCNS